MGDIIEGGCICGGVRYRVSGMPVVAAACHCTFCQKRTGSAFAMAAYFDEKAIAFLQGRLAEYEHRSDETGRWLRMSFCPHCGTPVSHTAEVRPGLRAIALGTLDDPDRVRIERHIWTRSKRPWVSIPVDVEIFAQAATPPALAPKSS